MSRISTLTDGNHPSGEKTTILNTKLNHRSMNEEKTLSPEYNAVVASLGMQEKNEVRDVLSRISELTGVEARLTEANKALSDAKTVIAGKDATIGNLQKDLDSATARLQVYEQKEADAKASAIQSFLQKPWTKAKSRRMRCPAGKRWLPRTSNWCRTPSVRFPHARKSASRSPPTPTTPKQPPMPEECRSEDGRAGRSRRRQGLRLQETAIAPSGGRRTIPPP